MIVACASVSLILSLLLCKYYDPKLSPDGRFYFERPKLRPYCMRRLLPAVLGKRFGLWRAVSAASACLAAFLVGWKLQNPWMSALALSLPCFRQGFAFPVLPDPVGLLFLSLAFATGRWEFAALGGLFCEKTPVFGALLTHPLALLGLIPPLTLLLAGERPTKDDPEWLKHPVGAAFPRIGRILDPKHGLFPWGGALGGVLALSPAGWASVLVGYAQLLTAQDGARLYTWAALPLLAAVPPQYAPLACLIGWASPYRDSI